MSGERWGAVDVCLTEVDRSSVLRRHAKGTFDDARLSQDRSLDWLTLPPTEPSGECTLDLISWSTRIPREECATTVGDRPRVSCSLSWELDGDGAVKTGGRGGSSNGEGSADSSSASSSK